MEITGKCKDVQNHQEGVSAKGPWKKEELIIETLEQYPKRVALQCWNGVCDAVAGFALDQVITAVISIESKEFNGRNYTEVRVIKFIENANQGQPLMGAASQQQYPAQQQPGDDTPF